MSQNIIERLVEKQAANLCTWDSEEKLNAISNGNYSELINRLIQTLALTSDAFTIYQNIRFSMADNITNKIIRYKDASKIAEPSLMCDYLLVYVKDDVTYAFVIDGESYYISKGMYYCFTEVDGILDGFRNNSMALNLVEDNFDEMVKLINKVVEKSCTVGYAQRELDRVNNCNDESLIEKCCLQSEKFFNQAKEEIVEATDRAPIISKVIMQCFLLKKFIYVQNMMNKEQLNQKFAGDIKQQRHYAKELSDKIPFVSFSELWRIEKINSGE